MMEERLPSAAGKNPPAQMKTIESKCIGRMNAAKPNAAAIVEKGNIQTADICMRGVMTVLEAEEKAHNVAK
jgi:hypothetical protein